MNLCTKQKQTHRLREHTYGCQEGSTGVRVRETDSWEAGTDMYTPLHLKWVTNEVLLCSARNPAQSYVAAWTGGEFWREWIHIYVWLSIRSHHFMGNRWGNNGNSVRLYFSGLQNHCRW